MMNYLKILSFFNKRNKRKFLRINYQEKFAGGVSTSPLLIESAKLLLEQSRLESSTTFKVKNNHYSEHLLGCIILATVAFEAWLNELIISLSQGDQVENIKIDDLGLDILEKYRKICKNFEIEFNSIKVPIVLVEIVSARNEITHSYLYNMLRNPKLEKLSKYMVNNGRVLGNLLASYELVQNICVSIARYVEVLREVIPKKREFGFYAAEVGKNFSNLL